MRDLIAARQRYVACNRRTLEWMLDRGPLHGAFLNTKASSITLADYTDADGWRGPSYTYGWIQGRGLEALTSHAAFFADIAPDLSARLDAAGRRLYHRLAELFDAGGERLFFCYDSDFRPVYRGAEGQVQPQITTSGLYTYADVFGIKGLLAAAVRFGDAAGQARYLACLNRLVASLWDGGFCHHEQQRLESADQQRQDDFGPWMIVLGAAGLLHRLNLGNHATFGADIVETVLNRFWPGRTQTGADLIPDWIGAPQANPGHAIEFVGFALEALPDTIDPDTSEAFARILEASFATGFRGPGIVLSVKADTGAPLSPLCPWWSLPETIRAAALLHERTGDERSARIWAQADDAFFNRYWRGSPPLAYQTMTQEGPIDFVPATPDLDPGYHTGLSLLAAIEAIDRLANRPAHADLKGHAL